MNGTINLFKNKSGCGSSLRSHHAFFPNLGTTGTQDSPLHIAFIPEAEFSEPELGSGFTAWMSS
jgi:hypothetical protein